jgi:TetR/AcrR family transcriptional repressor of mexJK operon
MSSAAIAELPFIVYRAGRIKDWASASRGVCGGHMRSTVSAIPPSEKSGTDSERSDWRGRQSPEHVRRRNHKLLEVAADLFVENGLEATSIDSIAISAGMTKRTIYQRFGDKTALFKAATSFVLKEWMLTGEDLHQAETVDPRESLLRIARALVARMMDIRGRRMIRLTNLLSYEMPELSNSNMFEGTDAIIESLSKLFARWPELRETTEQDLREAALSFMQLLLGEPGRATTWEVDMSEQEREDHAQFCVKLFIGGFKSFASSD